MKKATIIGLGLTLAFVLMGTVALACEPKLEHGFCIEVTGAEENFPLSSKRE